MSINALSCLQSIISKNSVVQAPVVYTVQSTKLRIWYKFNSNLTNSAPSFLGSNNGTIVSGSNATNTQIAISPVISGNSSISNMNTFNGGGTNGGNYTYINLQTISGLVLSQGFTICMYIYSTKTSGGDSYIFNLNNTSGNVANGIFTNGICISQPSVATYNKYVFNNYGNTPAIVIPPNTWTHLAISLSASNIYNVYINGVINLSSQTNPYAYVTATTFTNNSLGFYAPAGPHNSFRGNMADFRFYNTVLTAEEINAIHIGTG